MRICEKPSRSASSAMSSASRKYCSAERSSGRTSGKNCTPNCFLPLRAAALFGRDARPDRAGDAGAAEPAIAERVLRQILLVVILGEIELRRLADLGGDTAIAGAF